MIRDEGINKEKLIRDLKAGAQGLIKFAIWFAIPYIILLNLINQMGYVR